MGLNFLLCLTQNNAYEKSIVQKDFFPKLLVLSIIRDYRKTQGQKIMTMIYFSRYKNFFLFFLYVVFFDLPMGTYQFRLLTGRVLPFTCVFDS